MAVLKIKNNKINKWEDIITIKGNKGDKPTHEIDETRIRFQNPDGTWGEWIELEVLTAEQVPTSDGGNVQSKLNNSFNLGVLGGLAQEQNSAGTISIKSIDLNNLLYTGFYHCQSCTNTPGTGNGYMLVESLGGTYCKQTYTVNSTALSSYERQLIGGSWTDWKLVSGEATLWTGSESTGGTLTTSQNIKRFGALKITFNGLTVYAHAPINTDNNNVRASCVDIANEAGAFAIYGVVLTFVTTSNLVTIARAWQRTESSSSMNNVSMKVTKIIGLP